MSTFTDNYFGPLDESSCVYFYFFSVLGFIFMILAILSAVIYVVTSYKKIHFGILVNLVFAFISYFMLYYCNRLLYTICMKTL